MSNFRMGLAGCVAVAAFALVLVPGLAMADTVSGASAGNQYACAALADHTVQCWGSDSSGQLGDSGSAGHITTPVHVPLVGSATATSVSAGGDHACALMSDSSVQCWGSSGPPAAMPPFSSNPQAITAGSNFTCALAGASVQCWGVNDHGQLATTSTPSNSALVTAVPSGATSVSAGNAFACAVVSGGVQCWGSDAAGQLGNGAAGADSPTPVTVPGVTGAKAVSAGGDHACALMTDGSVVCWGSNDAGTSATIKGPTPIVGVAGATSLSAGSDFTCALSTAVQCWGDDALGQLGDNGTAGGASATPISVTFPPGAASPHSVVAGTDHACALMGDQSVQCWGANSAGQLGTGTTSLHSGPAQLQQALTLATTGAGTGTVTASPAGTPCGGTNTQCFAHGATVPVTATPAAGSGSEGLSGGCSGSASTCNVTLENAQSVTATFGTAPSASVTTPAGGTNYPVGSVPAAAFNCTVGASATRQSCTATVDGSSVVNGQPLAGRPGFHTLIATATDTDGLTASKTVTYTVSAPPSVAISGPVDGATYRYPDVPRLSYSCAPDQNSALTSCAASVDGTAVASGAQLPESLGAHTITLTASDADGLTAAQSVTYTVSLSVVAPPPVSITTPKQGASYHLGQIVKAVYSCLGTKATLKSCAGPVANGRPFDTRTLGAHGFTVTAHDVGGQSTSEMVYYKVVPTTNLFRIRQVKANASGVAHVVLSLPGPGTVAVSANAWNVGAANAFRRHFVYARARSSAPGAGSLSFTVKPNALGQALVKLNGAAPVLTLTITYTPTGGRPHALHAGRVLVPAGRRH